MCTTTIVMLGHGSVSGNQQSSSTTTMNRKRKWTAYARRTATAIDADRNAIDATLRASMAEKRRTAAVKSAKQKNRKKPKLSKESVVPRTPSKGVEKSKIQSPLNVDQTQTKHQIRDGVLVGTRSGTPTPSLSLAKGSAEASVDAPLTERSALVNQNKLSLTKRFMDDCNGRSAASAMPETVSKQAAAFAKMMCQNKQNEAWADYGCIWSVDKVSNAYWEQRLRIQNDSEFESKVTKEPVAPGTLSKGAPFGGGARGANEPALNWNPIPIPPSELEGLDTKAALKREFHKYRSFLYTIENDKRVSAQIDSDAQDFITSPQAIPHNTLLREIKLVAPEFLNEAVWQKHRYSLDDIQTTLQHTPKTTIWQICLYNNIALLQSATKVSSTSLIHGGRRSAILRLMSIYRQKFASWAKRPSVLLKLPYQSKQKIPLPCHRITPAGIQTLSRLLPTKDLTTYWLGQPLRNFTSFVKWEGAHFVPLAMYPRKAQRPVDLLLLARVVPYTEFKIIFGEPQNLGQWPDVVKIGDSFFCVMDESFYVWSLPTSAESS